MSKKLAENGRWESSRMMLPEHREALIDRKQPQPEPKRGPSKEELPLIRDFILLPTLLTYAENGRKSAEKIVHPFKELFVQAIDVLMDRLHADLVQARKELRGHNIKVWEDEQIDGTMWYRYVCRGYEDRFPITRDLVRAEMSVRLGKYFAAMFK